MSETELGYTAIRHSNPFGRMTGPFFEKDEEGGFVRAFRVDERHVNGLNVAHGGMLLTFADIVLGTAVFREIKTPAVTVRLVSDFVSPAQIGDWVEGRAVIDQRTRSLVFASGALTVGRRTVLTTSGVFHILAPKPAD
jgi:acyl-coenzyme A thioesterase PaaI-like protein